MKIPPGFLDSNGKAAKGDFVLSKGDDQVEVQEFGTVTEGNQTSCYVLTSPGDELTLSFALRAGIANHADFVVDGVLRNCRTAPTRGFNGSFDKVVYQGRKSGTKRAAVRYSRMMVKQRGTVEGMVSTDTNTPSKVGSLEVHLYRADPGSSTDSNSEALAQSPNADRPPAFDKCAEWYDCNSNLGFIGPPPPFEIGFFDHTEVGKSRKDSLTKDLPGDYKLWGIFTFNLRSAEDLRQLGFNCSPELTPSHLPSATDPLTGTSGPNNRGDKLDSDATSTEKALVEEMTGNVRDKTPDCAQSQKIKAAARPAPNLAPPTTVSGLLHALSSANRHASSEVRNNLDDISARGSSSPTTSKPNITERQAHVPRNASPQGVGASLSSEPVPATTIFQDSKEAVVLKQEFMDHQSAQSTKELLARTPTVLRGVGGKGTSPAHQAFLVKGSIRESETRSPTPSQDDRNRIDEDGSFPARLPNQRAIDTMFSPGKAGFSQSRGMAEEKPALSKSIHDHPNGQIDSLSFIKSAAFDLDVPHEGSQRPKASSRAPSEVSDAPTEVADPKDIARAVRSSERSTQSTNTSHIFQHDHLGLGIFNGPSFKTESIEYEQGNHTYPSPILGNSKYPTPRSNIGSPLHQSFTARAARGPSIGSPGQPLRDLWVRQATSNSPTPRQETPKNFPPDQALKQSDLRPTTPLKRKSDLMTGYNTPDAGSRKSSVAPGDRTPELVVDKAAAEARMAIAERKRADLKERLGAAQERKREKEKIRELNQRAADVERENAEMEAELALIDEENNFL
ncbi:hypothetical protein VTL71DRAFT_15041 [Oculimacula yallundae]|uniref:BZIP domain-containing protein n=1 Tax=Oculimacula yallundae TaxID=86028 RepID=A0ABR4CFG1_9HELO